MKRLKYDVSVIVAVYNNEKYVKDCIESILNQTHPLKKIQLILINDGSIDNSLNICNEYAEKHDNILVINQKNQGVSAARNAGLKAAEGKYIMVLDSDDTISNNTVKSLVTFFDNHYDEIDLVTYPMVNITKKNKNIHYRYGFFDKGTGVYDLEEYPYICQSNVNIMIKNYFENNIFYNTNMIFSEDEEYNTRVLIKKLKIGYCDEARYFYVKTNEASAVNNKSNPYYCFESLIEYHEDLLNIFLNKNEHVPKYVQGTILNDFRWRIKADELYPYYYKDDEYKSAILRIKNILKYIDEDVIRDMPNMDIYHKFAIINLKGTPIKYYFGNNLCTINTSKEILYSENNCVIALTKFKYQKDVIKIIGHIKSPLFYYTKPKLFIKVIDKEDNINIEEIDLKDSNYNLYKTKMDVAKFYNFAIDVKVDNVKSFEFYVEVDGRKLPKTYFFSNYVPFDFKMKRYTIYKDEYKITYNSRFGIFSIDRLTEKQLKEKKNIQFREILKKHKKVAIFRMLVDKNKKRKIWLYCDRDGVFDNAYYQFKHDVHINDGIERFYVIDDDFKKIKDKFDKNEFKNIIKYKSFKHKILFLSAEKVLTSFQYITYYSPFKKGIKWYTDIIKYELVYLQHGVLHCHTPWIYSNEKNEIDKIVVSSNYEIDNFINNYNYEMQNLIPSGMPRFDLVDINKLPMKKIVYAPTWRANLIGEIENNRRILKNGQFLESEYFKKIYSLLHSEKLLKILKDNEYVFEFKIHPVFKDYIDLFEVDDNNYIKVSADEIKLDEYKLFITDYSSYVFDYVYLERPIIYFLPDRELFDAGLHIYRKLDLPLEEGFGDITVTSDELIEKIEYYINNEFKVEEKYKERINNFFIIKDNHRDNLYNELMKGD